MNEIESALALKSLEAENAALKTLFKELQDASRYKKENELVEAVKAKVTSWARWIVTVFVAAAAVLGVTTFWGARDAAISSFASKTEPMIRKEFEEVVLPQIRTSIQNDATKRIDELTSSNAEQFERRMGALFEEMSRFAKSNKLTAPQAPEPLDSTGRPTAGYVLRSFLTKSVNETYVVNTYRLNIRDKPNGTILGRQVQNARVRIVEDIGDWVRIEVLP